MAAFFVVSSIAMLTTPRARVRADDAGLDAFDVDDVETLFSIRKSANRNRVDYGLRLDAGCRPLGEAPVVAYWRMLEDGEHVREPLLAREQRAYGVASQDVTATADGGRIALRLRALPDRTVVVNVRRSGGRCVARSITSIGGRAGRARGHLRRATRRSRHRLRRIDGPSDR